MAVADFGVPSAGYKVDLALLQPGAARYRNQSETGMARENRLQHAGRRRREMLRDHDWGWEARRQCRDQAFEGVDASSRGPDYEEMGILR